jgi:DNA-binding transcriptional MerR regulator
MRMINPLNFNTKTVSKITGLSIRQIDYWDRTHFIKPSINEASGYGSLRLYAFKDLVQLKIAKTLLDKGISLQKIRKTLNYLKQNMPEVEKPFLQLRFLTDGETIFVLTKNEQTIIDTLKSGQLVFSIALGEIVENLRGDIKVFGKKRQYIIKIRRKQYPVVLQTDTDTGKYMVACPSLPRCTARGDSIEEAIEHIKKAIEGHLYSTNPVNGIAERR